MKKERIFDMKYIARWITDEDGNKLPEYKYRQIVMTFTKRYHNCLYQLAGLNSSCRDLLDYLCERMDEKNQVYSNVAIREDFIKFIADITKTQETPVVYSHVTVKKAFSTLVNKQLIFLRSRGTYIVNPEFFSKTDEDTRLDQIQLIINFNKKDDVKEE